MKNLSKKLLVLIFIFAATGLVSAQSNFVPGYIITNKGDTINGLIDFRTNEINQKSCSFRLNKNTSIETFYPGDIHSYRFTEAGKYFVSKDIIIGFQDRKAFVEYLVQGTMNLYYYVSRLEGEYFFFDDKGKLTTVTKNRDNDNDDRYKVNLNNLFGEYNEIAERIPTSEFSKKTMVNVSRDYHNLTCAPGEECIIFENDYNRSYIEFKFTPYLGIMSYDYTFNGIALRAFGEHSAVAPTVGTEIDIAFPRVIKPLCFIVDLSLTKMSADLEVESTTTAKRYQEYEFDSVLGALEFGLKYTFQTDRIQPSIEAGYVFTRQFGVSSTYAYRSLGNSELVTQKDKHSPSDMPRGWSFGAGVDYILKNEHALVFSVSYNMLKNTQNYSIKGDEIKAFWFKLGYKF